MEVKQMWNNGPLRNFAPDTRPESHWMPYNTGGYVGSYVCAACRKTTSGVYQSGDRWICAECRADVKCGRLDVAHDACVANV